MALIVCRNVFRPSLNVYLPSMYSAGRMLQLNTPLKKQKEETFIEKNERLKRPLSPHLSIYKPQITWMLSGLHRATGVALASGLYTFAIGTLIIPAPFSCCIEVLQKMHIAAPIIFSFKFALAWTVFYHSANGIRHLAWDMGYGFDLKTLYISGYITIGVSLLGAIIAASM